MRPGRTIAAATVGMLLAVGLTAAPAAADINRDKVAVDRKVASLKSALTETSAALSAAYTKLQQTEQLLPAARAKLTMAQQAQTTAQQAADDAAARLAAARRDEQQAQQRIADNADDLAGLQHQVNALAAQVFQGEQPNQLAIALGTSSPEEFATALTLSQTVDGMTARALTQLHTARAEAASQQAYLAAVRDRVAALSAAADQALAAAQDATAASASATAALENLLAEQKAYAAKVEEQKAQEQQQLAEQEKEQARLAAELRALALRAGASAGAPTSHGGFLNYPANGPITSGYGMRYHPVLDIWRLHSGIDFGIACGTPLYATAAGRVISAGWAGGYGNRIVVDHGLVQGADLATTYNHLSRIVVSSGTVARGQLIGYSGTTGLSTGCHLHFETLVNGAFVNPLGWL